MREGQKLVVLASVLALTFLFPRHGLSQQLSSTEQLRMNRIQSCGFGTFSSWNTEVSQMREKERLARSNVEYHSLKYRETQIECRATQEIDALRFRHHPDRETVAQLTSNMCTVFLESSAKMVADNQARAERFRACSEYAARRANGMAEIEAYNSTTWRR